jgi:hypothetical protein
MSASTSNSARDRWRRAAAAGVAALLLLAARPAPAADEEGCLGCHGLSGLAVRDGGGRRDLGLAVGRLEASMHRDLGCRECHVDIVSIPHGERREPACGQTCHGQSSGGKEYSHEGLYWEYATSSHGSAKSRKIGCLVCHPAPERTESAERDKLQEARRCASCHRGSARVRDWFSDRHFLALAGGNRRAPSCPDCHSSHRVRPATSPESTVYPKRLADTCSNGAAGTERRGACHGALGPAAVAGASMNPLPRGRGAASRPLTLLFAALSGALAAGLVVRAGVGLVRGR